MSRPKFRRPNGVKLPIALQQELGLEDRGPRSGDRWRRGGGYVGDRKEKRKAMRVEKRTGRNGNRARQFARQEEEDSGVDFDEDEEALSEKDVPQARAEATTTKVHTRSDVPPPKSILKKPEPERRLTTPTATDSSRSRESSPGLVLDPSSKAFQDRAAQDDAEIDALERRLGMKSKKGPKLLDDDGLGDLLEGLDEETGTRKRKREGHEWLEGKRRKAADLAESDEDSDGMSDLEDDGDEENLLGRDESDLDLGNEDIDSDELEGEDELDPFSDGDEEDFSGFGSEEDLMEEGPPVKKVKENPYIAPVAPGASAEKYVPPSLRKAQEPNGQLLERLRKQVQGHLNKLSEANLVSILSEIEKLYQINPRQDVTLVLIDLLLSSFCNRSSLQNTFIILHAAFVSALYKVMGTDFGAEMLVKLVERFDQYHTADSTGKEGLNLISLLANLFTFNVISSSIVYDYVRLLLADFSESSAELLLRVVRDCGPQLRSDDPTALKDIVQTMHNISADMTANGQQPNIRTRVMMDTITDLKNNKMKNATNAAGATGEHITRMRKVLGSLNNRNLKATEPLRITRDDIANSDKKGKWWLVGASWKGHERKTREEDDEEDHSLDSPEADEVDAEIDLLALARQYRMNTDVRRSIFVAIMSATDCRDAQMRLLKLRLTRTQEQEIAKVLLRCARAEPAYNPYYTLVAKDLCKEIKKVRVGFQFGLWDFFSRMGEKADDDESDSEDDEQTVEMNEIVNIAKMYAYLISHGHLPIGVLKTLNIGFLKEQATMFLEVLLITIMTQPKATDDAVLKVFGRAADTPQMVQSLQYFIKKHVRRSDLVSKKDKEKVKNGCKIADTAFQMIHAVEFQE